jgi:hypothetical protein
MATCGHTSRPVARPVSTSTRRYHGFLAAVTRAMLTLIALMNLSLLLAALRSWTFNFANTVAWLIIAGVVAALAALAAITTAAGT